MRENEKRDFVIGAIWVFVALVPGYSLFFAEAITEEPLPPLLGISVSIPILFFMIIWIFWKGVEWSKKLVERRRNEC